MSSSVVVDIDLGEAVAAAAGVLCAVRPARSATASRRRAIPDTKQVRVVTSVLGDGFQIRNRAGTAEVRSSGLIRL
jgi:hypothetical protein